MMQGNLFNNYHNTTQVTGAGLMAEEANATEQGERVMRLFGPFVQLAPSRVHALYCRIWPAVPITSIRRAITNLTTQGRLEKTGNFQVGLYGKREHLWKIKSTIHNETETKKETGAKGAAGIQTI